MENNRIIIDEIEEMITELEEMCITRNFTQALAQRKRITRELNKMGEVEYE